MTKAEIVLNKLANMKPLSVNEIHTELDTSERLFRETKTPSAFARFNNAGQAAKNNPLIDGGTLRNIAHRKIILSPMIKP